MSNPITKIEKEETIRYFVNRKEVTDIRSVMTLTDMEEYLRSYPLMTTIENTIRGRVIEKHIKTKDGVKKIYDNNPKRYTSLRDYKKKKK